MKHKFQDSHGGTAFLVRVVPRSSKNKIVEIMSDGTVRIHLTAPPIEGKANRQLVEFLSATLKIKPTQIEIVAGEKSKNKLVTVDGLTPSVVEQILREKVQEP
ncbi:MAG: DUF167 domain-containing protein [Anaerolineales bacterium]